MSVLRAMGSIRIGGEWRCNRNEAGGEVRQECPQSVAASVRASLARALFFFLQNAEYGWVYFCDCILTDGWVGGSDCFFRRVDNRADPTKYQKRKTKSVTKRPPIRDTGRSNRSHCCKLDLQRKGMCVERKCKTPFRTDGKPLTTKKGTMSYILQLHIRVM